MSIENILELPHQCLLLVFMELDMRGQCNFGSTCSRFQAIYHLVHQNDFRNFVWYDCTNLWSHREIQSFFKLNGYKMEMLSLTDVRGYNMEMMVEETNKQNVNDNQNDQNEDNEQTERKEKSMVVETLQSKTIHLAQICVYLTNLRSLFLTIDQNCGEIVIEISRHMRQLQDLIIFGAKNSNYEHLALLPNLQNLDLEYFAMNSNDKLFESLAKLRPRTLQTLFIGSKLKLDQFQYICQLSCLHMLNINNPSCFALKYLLRMENLRILNLTDAYQLQNIDFIRLLCGLKRLSTLYVSYCMKLSKDFVFFAIQYLYQESLADYGSRRFPFHLECYCTGLTEDINKTELVCSSVPLIQIKIQTY